MTHVNVGASLGLAAWLLWSILPQPADDRPDVAPAASSRPWAGLGPAGHAHTTASAMQCGAPLQGGDL